MPIVQTTMKWILAIFAVLGGWLSGGIAGIIAAGLAGFWDRPIGGFGAAFVTVVVAYLAAPNHKLLSASVVLVLGAVLAWLALEPSFYPKSYRGSAYERTHLPIIATYMGAVLGLALVVTLNWRAGPDNPFKPAGR